MQSSSSRASQSWPVTSAWGPLPVPALGPCACIPPLPLQAFLCPPTCLSVCLLCPHGCLVGLSSAWGYLYVHALWVQPCECEFPCACSCVSECGETQEPGAELQDALLIEQY